MKLETLYYQLVKKSDPPHGVLGHGKNALYYQWVLGMFIIYIYIICIPRIVHCMFIFPGQYIVCLYSQDSTLYVYFPRTVPCMFIFPGQYIAAIAPKFVQDVRLTSTKELGIQILNYKFLTYLILPGLEMYSKPLYTACAVLY